MAKNVYLTLTANDQTIEGGSEVESMERWGTIECVHFEHILRRSVDSRGTSEDHARLETLKFVKPIDVATPLLQRAFEAAEVLQATFRFYEPWTESGEIQSFTIEVENAYMTSIEMESRSGDTPAYESIELVAETVTYTYTGDGTSHRTGSLRSSR